MFPCKSKITAHLISLKFSMVSSFNPRKDLKQQFVSNLSGTSLLEIFALSFVIPGIYLLRHKVVSHYLKDFYRCNIIASRDWKAYFGIITIDFLLIVLPMLLLFTVLADYTFTFAAIVVLFLIFPVVAKRLFSPSPDMFGGPVSLRENISSFRVSVMIITFLCILGVDFHIFPRKLAKTETYGVSLMDLGVGSFVVANSFVSRHARNVSTINMKNTLLSTCPLIILGFGRLISTTGVDYQVHVGEYGVHWNFFFTLAAVSILTSIFNIRPQHSGVVGLLILAGYQFCLMNGLNAYLLSDERGTDIISQNKEGIFSVFGYWGMYLLGVQLGNYLFFGNHASASSKNNELTRIKVWILSLLFWLITMLLENNIERVSRRMCNLPYVTFVFAGNLQLLAVLMLSDYFTGSRISVLEEAFNGNLLGLFLLANILTGLVNLSVDTMFASSGIALFILIVYAYSLSVITGFVNFFGIRLKFW